MRVHVRVLLLVTLLLLGSACEAKTERQTAMVQFFSETGEALSPELTVELALTAQEQQVGLMYRKEMAETKGMLFVFADERVRSFWMKNTYLTLDIIYLDVDRRVVSIIHEATPLSTKPRPSGLPAKYVVEVNGGLAKKWGLKPGSLLKTSDLPQY